MVLRSTMSTRTYTVVTIFIKQGYEHGTRRTKTKCKYILTRGPDIVFITWYTLITAISDVTCEREKQFKPDSLI